MTGASGLPSQYQEFIFYSRYARWIESEKRRETWAEAVNRYLDFVAPAPMVNPTTREFLFKSIHELEVMPSMRALMSAGPAAERCNVSIYNCAYTPIDKPRRLAEILYILMCGTGVGYSVEKRYIDKLPVVPSELCWFPIDDLFSPFVVKDSKRGWAEAIEHLIDSLYAGLVPDFDFSEIRPAGARLKTMGGRASGPEPLKNLIGFIIGKFTAASLTGRRLTSLEVHDICCMIGEVVVVGGVRRSALIALFDRDDEAMRTCKAGEWWNTAPWRALANNSAVYESKPSLTDFMSDWRDLIASGSGEPGIFSREACRKIAARAGRDPNVEYGTNPCSEIILRPQQFCNLTEVVCRAGDTEADMLRKVRAATILGTLQACFTTFDFLGPEWSVTTAAERLLGVSQTGILDGTDWRPYQLEAFRESAKTVNAVWAKYLDIHPSAAITCVKPSGTVSQLVDSASGIHPRHAPYYIRRVRGDIKDPVSQFLMAQGVPWERAIGKEGQTAVFDFPTKAPNNAATREGFTAVEHLREWLKYQKHWCDHKPSVTINVKPDEWFATADFVWQNWEWMSGVAFLPFDGGTYKQAPYEEIDGNAFNDLASKMPALDWSKLPEFEAEDSTVGGQTLACTAGACEIVDLI